MDRHRSLALHGGAVAVLFLLQFVLPPYHHTNFTSIMVLATYGIGYNILIGYTGLLSLGHAMFFAAGLYAAGLTVHYFGIDPVSAFVLGALAALVFATAVGLIALRTTGVSFMIVTMMFAQACFLLILYFNEVTRGDEGIAHQRGRAADRRLQPDQSDAALQPRARAVRGRAHPVLRPDPLARRPRPRRDPRERGAGQDAGLPHLPLQAAGAGAVRPARRARRARPMR